MGARLEPPPSGIQKTLKVRRSDRSPTLYWWNLPLSLPRFGTIFAESLQRACALVYPASALAGCGEEIGAVTLAGQTLRVDDIAALLQARDEGRAAACRIAIFPPTRTGLELQRAAERMSDDLEKLGFTVAILPDGDGRVRHDYCFRVPGKVLEAVEALALGRGFGGNLGQVEMALLQALALRPHQEARLQLTMQEGKAALVGVDRSGRRRIQYLESGKGFTGTYEELSLREALRERMQESWRRFPVGVVMFAGLPFFIGAFWMKNTFFSSETNKPQDGGRGARLQP